MQKLLILTTITCDIPVELGRPPFRVILGRGAVSRASMPEAPVNKNRNTRPREHNIRCPWNSSEVHAVPHAQPVQFPPKRELNSGVLPRHHAHLPPDRVTQRQRGHLLRAISDSQYVPRTSPCDLSTQVSFESSERRAAPLEAASVASLRQARKLSVGATESLHESATVAKVAENGLELDRNCCRAHNSVVDSGVGTVGLGHC